MRYLTLRADYMESGLHDDFEGPIDPAELGLDESLGADIADWNHRYRVIVPLDPKEREAPDAVALIGSLDDEGLALAERIVMALADGSKVRYFSEGLLRHLR